MCQIVRNLVSKGNVKEALQSLKRLAPSSFADSIIGLSSRYASLQSQRNLGMINFSDAQIEQNKIAYSILSICDEIDDSSIVKSYNSQKGEIDYLRQVIAKNKRRRPQVAKDAQALIDEFSEYATNKASNPSFDITGRRKKALDSKCNAFLHDLNESKKDSLEAIVEKINKYIEEPVPSYKKLKAAYDLCAGRRLTDVRIEKILKKKPDDFEARITVAEWIESAASQIIGR